MTWVVTLWDVGRALCLCAQVVGLPEYQTWLRGFPEGTRHILAAAWKGCPVLESSAELQARLNAVAPQFFPLHQQRSLPVLDEQGSHVTPGQNLLRIHLRPKRDDPLDSSELLPRQSSSGPEHCCCKPCPMHVQEAHALGALSGMSDTKYLIQWMRKSPRSAVMVSEALGAVTQSFFPGLECMCLSTDCVLF